jgi:hypothetical protein
VPFKSSIPLGIILQTCNASYLNASFSLNCDAEITFVYNLFLNPF